MMHNKKYIFGLRPYFWHRAPKALGISNDKSDRVSFVMLIK